MNPDILNLFCRTIRENERFVIVGHVNPDGDCIGSQIALFLALKQLGKDAVIINDEAVPERYLFLPYVDQVHVLGPEKSDAFFDVFLSLDTSRPERHGRVQQLMKRCTTVLCLDHHIVQPQNRFADIDIRDEKSSSTGELLYSALKALDITFNTDICTALYTAIVTDTERFLFDNTRPETMIVTAELMRHNINAYEINRLIFQNIPADVFRLFSVVVRSMVTEYEGRFLWAVIRYSDFQNLSVFKDDVDHILKLLVHVRGADVVLLFKEQEPDFVSVNLRSKSEFNVEVIARQFNGGGHKKASGIKMSDSLDGTLARILPIVREKFEDYIQ